MRRFRRLNENVRLQYLSQERNWPLCSPGKCCVLSLHPFPARKPGFQQKAQVRWVYLLIFPNKKELETEAEAEQRQEERKAGAEGPARPLKPSLRAQKTRAGLTGSLKQHTHNKTFRWLPSSLNKAIKWRGWYLPLSGTLTSNSFFLDFIETMSNLHRDPSPVHILSRRTFP